MTPAVTIDIDGQTMLDQGYLVVPQCVPAEQLEAMRRHCELMLERHKKWWADHRAPADPPGGEWETSIQPRVLFDRVVDRDNCQVVEFVFHANTYGVSQRIMQCRDVAPTQFGMFCNPRRDHGPADWHRDIRPPVHGNVESFYVDFLANPPHYTQWNIALYDDDVLWLVPGSHRRFNTAAENRQLAHSEHEPVEGGIPIELQAGDGVVYLTPLLHWGSNYSTRPRRTLQFAYRAFGNGSLTHAHHLHWTPEVVERLPGHLAARFRRFLALKEEEYDVVERIFRAVLARDEAVFMDGLVALHAGEVGRMSAVLHLCKMAQGQVRQGKGPLGGRFTGDEAELLWRRFAAFDRLLQADEPYLIPGFQTKEASVYNFNEMPAMDVGEFVASW